MRIACAALFAVVLVALSDRAQAIEYPWCAEYLGVDASTNCGFITHAQCMASISGVGGFCRENPAFRAAQSYQGELRPSRRARPH